MKDKMSKTDAGGAKSPTGDWKDEVHEIRWRAWHRIMVGFVQWVETWEARSGILAWVQNWVMTLHSWYMPLPKGTLEGFEELAKTARRYCPDIKPEDFYDFFRLNRLPSSEAQLQAVFAATDPQAYMNYFKEHPDEKRLFTPSRYVEYAIPHR